MQGKEEQSTADPPTRGSLFSRSSMQGNEDTSRVPEEQTSARAQTSLRRKPPKSAIAQYERLSSEMEQLKQSINQHFQVQEQMLHNLTCLITRASADQSGQELTLPEAIERPPGVVTVRFDSKELSQSRKDSETSKGKNAEDSSGTLDTLLLPEQVLRLKSKLRLLSAESLGATAAKTTTWKQVKKAINARLESEEPPRQGWQEHLRSWVASTAFSVGVTCLVLANILCIAVECEGSWKWGRNEIPMIFPILDLIFAVAFVVEVSVVMLALGFKEYFCRPERYWNWFDMFLTATPFVERLLSWALEAQAGPVRQDNEGLRLLRLLRLTRVARGVKIVGYVSALRDLLLAIASTMKSLLWASVMLLLILLFFGLLLTQLVMDHCRQEAISFSNDLNALPACSDQKLNSYWSSLPESVLTLFQSITGGISWRDASEPLRAVSWLTTPLVVMFIVTTDLAVLNVFIGVFCNAAIAGASRSREAVLQSYLDDQSYVVATIQEIFTEMDHDDSKYITLDEFELGLRDPRLQSFLASLNINIDDAWRLFSLLDEDRSGHLHLEEFVEGCLRLRGQATTVHYASLTRDMRNQMAVTKAMQKQIQSIALSTRDLRHAPPPPPQIS
eukprot:TRINITY_DN10080_c0_g1_i1.p1 TRINITY_DN10080_c0_g1~~TRINITY_DN10080_c0_g1_i1.p1  ORF type:complete len:617 (-),score=92.90 TRINITY_DN10080_c0_g1_i1:96-1946(-)